MKTPKSINMGVRLKGEQHARFSELSEATGIPVSTLAIKGLEAIYEHYQTHGHVSFPFRLVPLSHDEREAYRATYGKDPETKQRPA